MDLEYTFTSVWFNLISIVISIVTLWKIFTKAGEKGWKAIIPFYNIYVLFELTWGSGILFLLLLIPIFNIYVIIKTCLNVARAFGKGGGYATGLFFLSPILGLIIAFSDMQYLGVPKKVNGTVTYTNGPGEYNNPNNNTADNNGYYNQEPQQTNTTNTYAGEGTQNQNTTYGYTENTSYTNNGNEGTAYDADTTASAPQSSPQASKSVCPACGTAVDEGTKFCPTCGAKLN